MIRTDNNKGRKKNTAKKEKGGNVKSTSRNTP